jgi:hypothetical protein
VCSLLRVQIVNMEDLDASLVSSGKSEAEAALGKATDEVFAFANDISLLLPCAWFRI